MTRAPVANDLDVADRLGETEGRFRTMADFAPVLLWMAGTDAMCDFFNQVWLDFTGRSMEQEVGIGWAEGIHPEDFQRSVDTYLAAFNERREFKMVYRLRRHDGAYRFILDNGVPRFTPGGSFAGYIGSCVDITERVEAEQEKVRLVAELTDALRMREDFISIASHELKTPLTSLRLHVERLEKWASGDAMQEVEPMKVRRATTVSLEQVERLEKLVEDMLVSSRAPREVQRLTRSEVDLARLVRDVVARFAVESRDARCDVEVTGDAALVGSWDPARLEQVVVNLLLNAIKYAEGSRVILDVSRRDRHARLTVSDGGRGIAKADHTRIFGRFERAIGYSEVSGMGLGLYIARMAVEAHGGSIHVDSELGHGAEFEVLIPFAAAPV